MTPDIEDLRPSILFEIAKAFAKLGSPLDREQLEGMTPAEIYAAGERGRVRATPEGHRPEPGLVRRDLPRISNLGSDRAVGDQGFSLKPRSGGEDAGAVYYARRLWRRQQPLGARRTRYTGKARRRVCYRSRPGASHAGKCKRVA